MNGLVTFLVAFRGIVSFVILMEVTLVILLVVLSVLAGLRVLALSFDTSAKTTPKESAKRIDMMASPTVIELFVAFPPIFRDNISY